MNRSIEKAQEVLDDDMVGPLKGAKAVRQVKNRGGANAEVAPLERSSEPIAFEWDRGQDVRSDAPERCHLHRHGQQGDASKSRFGLLKVPIIYAKDLQELERNLMRG